MLSRIFSIAQSFKAILPALRSSIADFCSSQSVTTTALRKGATVTAIERESSSSSLPSRIWLPVTPLFLSLRTAAKVILSPGLRVRSSLTWMMEFSSVPMYRL
ncbi:hypothetical protein D9M69_621980 [compost metagenome]